MSCKKVSIMQGDQYGIPFTIRDGEGNVLTEEDLEDVEIVIGSVKKRLANGEIQYRKADQAFVFPITQQESFSMFYRKQRAQVRVKFRGTGEVAGKDLGDMLLDMSVSKEAL